MSRISDEESLAVQRKLLAASAKNFAAMLDRQADAHPNRIAFLTPSGPDDGPNTWLPMTFAEFRRQAHEVAAGLMELGLPREGRVALLSGTRTEWIIADMAISCAGGATTTIYPNSGPEEASFILVDSDSSILFVDSTAQVAKIQGRPDVDAVVRHIISFVDDSEETGVSDDRLTTMANVIAHGRRRLAVEPDLVRRMIDSIEPEDLCTLIYTSGTTGTPKGVELAHRAWTYMGQAWKSLDVFRGGDVHLLWLPLSHAFGKCLIAICVEIGITQAVEPRIPRLARSLGEVKPRVMCGVPRIFEKIRAGVMTAYPQGRLASRVSRWAFAAGRDAQRYRRTSDRLPVTLAARLKIADALVFSTLRRKLGEIEFMICGGAKLSEQVQQWFFSAGIPIVEGYGATEIGAVSFFSGPNAIRSGTVGPVAPGCLARIAEDGEVLVAGPIVARGYHNLPEKTVEAFTDGWFHTGDIGEFDEENYLRITDRKRDLFKTSGGKYVAPQKVEATLMANCPYLSNAVVLGEGHKYAVALLALDKDALMTWGKRHGRPDANYAELSADPRVRRSIQVYVDRANSRLERWETVKKFAILDHDLTEDAHSMTTSLKVRRGVVAEKYSYLLDEMFADENDQPGAAQGSDAS
ncbi:AMP-dependent synthetase/ligase [Cutibacterium modestum]|uniref:AMP-dependent synthetase/ligase n=1 Tax=Cutibacterium modestum TaxID=2559073 RepID=UPI000F063CCA|nr:long-chain fatty acid--CoA ligase [Cutibacterium modestum]MCP2377400.1 putative long-chain fatty-acid CoA ligase (AMP-binding enzyme) [Cutibacterium modestum 31N]